MARIDVVSQLETDGLLPDGTYGRGVRVTATLNGGPTTFTVFVPVAGYTPDKVREALALEAAKRAPVDGMSFEV